MSEATRKMDAEIAALNERIVRLELRVNAVACRVDAISVAESRTLGARLRWLLFGK